jgi:hypothetical protein
MACGKRLQPIHEGVEFEQCEFEDSYVYGAQYWPRTQVQPLSLAANAVRRVETISDVVQTMYVHVRSGVLSFWWTDHSGTPDPAAVGEQEHMEFTSQPGPHEIILPPGQHRMVFGAGNSAAVVATVTILDREGHR